MIARLARQLAVALFAAALGMLTLLTSSPAAGASLLPARERPMYFEHLTLRDGLSQNTVMSVLQDSQGFMWFATESGLDRYDGYSIRHYRRGSGGARGLASDFIWSIAEDANQDLWLATVGGGVVRWNRDTDTFTSFRHDAARADSIASDALRVLLIGRDGRIWLGTEREGLDVLDPRDGTVHHFRHDGANIRSLPNDAVYALCADSAGQIWVGTDGGLSRLEPDGNGFINYAARRDDPYTLSDDQVRSIHEDRAGALWVGTVRGGLNRIDRASGRTQRYQHDAANAASISDQHVRVVLEDDGGRLWVGTAAGLDLLDRESGRFAHYPHDVSDPQSLKDSYVMALYQDRGGILWVGTRGGGVSRWNPRAWLFGHYLSNGMRDLALTSFAADDQHTLWVGSAGRGLVAIDRRNGTETGYPRATAQSTGISDERVMSLLLDRSGMLWIGTMTGGLDRLDPRSGAIRVYRHDDGNPHSLPANGVMSLFEDSHGALWVGTFGGGVVKYRAQSDDFAAPMYAAGSGTTLTTARITALVEDLHGNLWIGTAGQGLSLLDVRSGAVTNLRRDTARIAGLSDDTVYALHLDKRGDLWVGTAGGGLDRISGSSLDPASLHFANFSSSNGLPSDVVYGVHSDAQGSIWASTNNGLARIDTPSGAVKVFHESQGLQAEEFNFGAHYQAASGELIFGGNNGFNAFVPRDIAAAAPPPRVVLTELDSSNQPLTTGMPLYLLRQAQLRHSDDVVTFGFAALDYTAPANNRYAYMLEGLDHDWIQSGSARQVTYTNLAAGRYVFRVKAANADGVWNDAALALPLAVAPAPWNTSSARLAYAAIVVLALFYIWRLLQRRRTRERQYQQRLEQTVATRTIELQQRNAELQVASRARSDFVARMSHELRTPMNGVLGMADLLLYSNLNGAQRRFATAIQRSADSLIAIVDDIMDFSKIEASRMQLAPACIDLGALVENTAEILAARTAEKGLELVCELPSMELPSVNADPVVLRRVLVNLLGNAVKFTERGEIVVTVRVMSEDAERIEICLSVRDTGVGIKPENQQKIFDAFIQEDATTTRRFGGTGLGLSITSQLVELMGGTLTVESQPGVGSTFAFTAHFDKAAAAAAAPANLAGLHVLVAEPNTTTRQLLTRALRDWGAMVASAGNGATALQLVNEALGDAQPFDFVLLGAALPDASARDLSRHIRQRGPATRILLLATFATLNAAEDNERQDFDAQLAKPVALRELRTQITTLRGARPFTSVTLRAVTPPQLPILQARVLLVEDQELNRVVATSMLSAMGCQVTAAENGFEALRQLRGSRFDVVLMDCQMPGMDGYACSRAIREQQGAQAHTPIVALTADATSDGRDRCRAAGMDDHVCKPFTRAELHRVLSHWVPQQSAAESNIDEQEPASSVTSAVIDEGSPLLDLQVLETIRALPAAGASSMLQHIVGLYFDGSAERLQDIEAALRQGSAEAVARAAHAWRSCHGNVGATSLAAHCRELEEAARGGDLQRAGAVFRTIGMVYPLVCDRLRLEAQLECA